MKKVLSMFLSAALLAGTLPGCPVMAAETDADEYVLMNIPYAQFYAGELGDTGVDSIASATLNGKARNVNVNGASYHQSEEAVKTEGIAGSTYPVKASAEELAALKAKGAKEVTDADKVEYEMNVRGTMQTKTLEGAMALQESPDYSYYVLKDAPASYKELNIAEDGTVSFGAAAGTAETGTVTGTAEAGGNHTDIEIKLSGAEIAAADVSGVIVTTEKGSYAMHHVVNIWRGTELGWDLGDLDLGGETISRIRYFMKDGSIVDYSTEIPIPGAAYVLMNIPYADFYKAELGESDAQVDALASATKSKTRGTLAAGSYHKNADGSDISGVIYPVFVADTAVLKDFKEVTDSDKVEITVSGRGGETTTAYEGKDALFENEDYAYYKLSAKPARFKKLTVAEDGTKIFSAVSGRVPSVADASGEVNENAHHTDVEIVLSNTAGIETGQAVSAVVVTFEDNSKIGLHHVAEIWRATELGGSAADFADKKIKNIRYYTPETVIDFPMEISIKKKAASELAAAFESSTKVTLSGLPEDIENPVVTIQSRVGRGETPVVIADSAEIKDGAVTTEAAVSGTTYTVKVSSDNYLPLTATIEYKELQKFEDVPEGIYFCDAVYWAVEKAITNGIDETHFGPDGECTRGQMVTFLYRAMGKPEVKDKTNPFTDVKADQYYTDAVLWAVEQGITKGMSANTFEPDTKVTRGQAVTFLSRVKNEKAEKPDNPFEDVASGAYYYDAVLWAVEKNITKGMDEKIFGPDLICKRSQIVTFLYRYLG
ncbi:MAG: S-layer homology domain-containing protein [Firmicutes bacterium]|nr:S-layer homology domain-containing protein [Bacillota bacterium]